MLLVRVFDSAVPVSSLVLFQLSEVMQDVGTPPMYPHVIALVPP